MWATDVDTIRISFWIGTLLLLYSYLGYPLAVVIWSRIRHRRVDARARYAPWNAVVVAHDEETLRNRIWFQTVSHKLLWLSSPLLLAVVAVASLLRSDAGFYRAAFGLQLAFCALAVAGHLVMRGEKPSLTLGVPYAICLFNWATLVGLFRFLTGRWGATWERAN
jgi:hypothetical protein